MVWGTAIKIIGSLAKKAEPLVKSSRKMPSPRTHVSTPKNNPGNIIPQAAAGISKESQTIGARAINQYNDILKQLPEGPAKDKLLANLDKEAWNRTYLSQCEKLDKAIQELINQKVDIKRGINSRGITEIPQIKPYGYWNVKLPHGEIKVGFSYPALLKLSEKLTPIEKSKFLSSLEEALQLPLKPADSSKIVDLVDITNNNITVSIGNVKLAGKLWDDGVYTIDTIGK